MQLTRQQEGEIYPILDKALDLEKGKGVLHRCTAARADYLARMIQGVRYDSAIESIEMYKMGDPLYGLGSYARLWVEPHDQGLLATLIPSPAVNLMWRIIQCAAFHQPMCLTPTTYNRARQRLARAQKKYPNIMNALYITEKDGEAYAMYGEVELEEVLIVDIDIAPGKRLKDPTDEQVDNESYPDNNITAPLYWC